MAEIVETIVGDRALRLYNEQFGRRMIFGAQWGKLRVGVRFTCQATSAVNASGLVLGVCQGTTNMFRSATCTDFVGGHLGQTVQNTNWVFTAGPPSFLSSGGFSTLGIRKIGPTVTSTITGGSQTSYISTAPTRGIFAVDIEKSRDLMRVIVYSQALQANAQTDMSFGNFMFQMDNEVTLLPIIAQSPNPLSVAYTGQYAFDSVCVDWNNAVQPIEISDLVVIRYF